MLLELGVGQAQSCSRGVPTQPPVFYFWSLAGEQWGSSLIKQCLREKRVTEKLAIRCDFTGAQEHDLFLSIFIFAWLMSMFLHRKADSQWEGLQYNPFALGQCCKGGWQRLRHADPAGLILPWGHEAWWLFQPILLSQGEVRATRLQLTEP